MRLTASKSSGNSLPPPIPGDALLIPITSWEAMYTETQVKGVEFREASCWSFMVTHLT